MALALTITDVQSGAVATATEGGATGSLSVHDSDSISFGGTGANAGKSVRLESGTDGSTFPTLVQTVTANSDGSYSFNVVLLGSPVAQPLYYRAHAMTT